VTTHDDHGWASGADPNYRHLLNGVVHFQAIHQWVTRFASVVHNHPSGDPSPSRADIEITRNVAEAGKRLGIAVHDHIIMGSQGHASLRAMGLI